MRGFLSVSGIIYYVIILILAIHFIPGLVASNNGALATFDTQNPAWIVLALFPLIFFAKYLFQGITQGEQSQ